MTWLDAGAVVVVALAAIAGFRRGLVVGAASLGGLAAGAYAGAKVAPHLLGDRAFYPPLVALGGAVVGAGIGQMLAVLAGRSLRQLLRLGLLRAFDNLTGGLLGAVTGFALVWVVAAVLLYAPGDGSLRRAVQRSAIAGSLTSALPPAEVIGVLARIDPFAALAGPEANVAPPDPAVLRDPDVRAAARSVVRVTGNACGLGIEGSGWVAAAGLVVTNAHVVGGVARPRVSVEGGRAHVGRVVAFDASNDLAVLSVPGLRAPPLPAATPSSDVSVAVLGFPENGPFHAEPGRLGTTAPTLARDAYGRFPVAREVTTIRADVRPGNSGGPAVDAEGRVRAVVFARRAGSGGGYGVPVELLAGLLEQARSGQPLSTDCAEG